MPFATPTQRRRPLPFPPQPAAEQAGRRGVRPALALATGALVATAASSLVVLGAEAAHADTYVAAGGYVAQDTFARTVSAGLGSAGIGGHYTTSGSAAKLFAVDGTHAVIGPVPTANAAAATLLSVRAVDVLSTLDFTVPTPASTGSGEYVDVEMRRQANGDTYRARVRVATDGRLIIGITRVRSGVETQVGSLVDTGLRATPGQVIRLQGSVTGSSPTVVNARTWIAGTTTPGWQTTYTDSGSTRIADPGSVGVWTYTSGGSAATTVQLDTYSVVTLSAIGTPPAATSSTPTSSTPTTSAPTSSTPTTSAPAPTSSTPTSSTPTTSAPVAPVAVATRGSVPVGSAAYPVPANAIFVSPTAGVDANAGTLASPLRTVQAAIARAVAGQTIVLRGGTYHESVTVAPTKSVTIQAYPNEAVWFDGSVAVPNWTRSGSTWVSNGWTAQFDHSASFAEGSDAGGFVNSTYPMAAYPDQLFVDGAQFAQVSSTTTPGPGQFAVDDSTGQLILGSDPTGHSVRASDLSQAFVVSGQVTLRGFGVRRYATSLPQIGTVYLGGSVGGDVLQNLVISDNATQGLSFSASRTLVDHVTASANGMVGIHSNNSSGSVIQNSLISGNNTQHFNSAPAAAGIKVTRDDGLVIRNNDVVDNLGVNGIWTDVSVSNFAIVGNTVARNNGTYGIITELSDTGIVAGNTVSDATRGYTAFDTGNVRVFNNVFSGNSVWDVGVWQDARRNTGSNATTIPWISRNISVSNNVFASSTEMFQFYALDKATNTPASGMNLVVTGNVFGLFPSGPRMVGWGGSNNVQVTSYASPAALNTGLQVSWHNMQVQLQAPAMATPALTAAGTLIAVPLPADIASQLGVAAGTAQLGAF